MRKQMLLGALLIGVTHAVRGARDMNVTQLWIADFNSLQFHGKGAPIDWTTFTDASFGAVGQRVVPNGYPVMLNASGKIVPADGSAGSETLFLFSNASELSKGDSISGYGLVTGGNLYEAYLPTSTGTPRQIPTAVRAKVSARVRLQ